MSAEITSEDMTFTAEELEAFQQVDQYNIEEDLTFQKGLEYIIDALMKQPMKGRDFERELCRAKAVYVSKRLELAIDASRYVDYKHMKYPDIPSSECPYLAAIGKPEAESLLSKCPFFTQVSSQPSLANMSDNIQNEKQISKTSAHAPPKKPWQNNT
jgi:hypothetical protein